jgi:hypothetical protein
VFIEDCEVRPREKAEKVVVPEPCRRVRVLSPFSVSYDGVAYWAGSVVEVPESLAANWVVQRWVESLEPEEPEKPRRRGKRL